MSWGDPIQEENSEDSGSEHGSPTNAGHKHLNSSSHSRRKMDKKKRRWAVQITTPICPNQTQPNTQYLQLRAYFYFAIFYLFVWWFREYNNDETAVDLDSRR